MLVNVASNGPRVPMLAAWFPFVVVTVVSGA